MVKVTEARDAGPAGVHGICSPRDRTAEAEREILSVVYRSEEFEICEELDAHEAFTSGQTRGVPSPARPVRILIADDHRIVRAGLAGLLGSRPEVDVIGLAADGLQAVEFAGRLQPDVVVMDVTMPGLSGMDATRLLRRDHPEIRVVGLSMHDSPEIAAAMREAGAAAYVTKGGPPEELLAAILGAMA